jgi:rubrerythrin
MKNQEHEHIYTKGELVPRPGTYRCLMCGESWTTNETGVRFPPCDASKTDEARWVFVEPAAH